MTYKAPRLIAPGERVYLRDVDVTGGSDALRTVRVIAAALHKCGLALELQPGANITEIMLYATRRVLR